VDNSAKAVAGSVVFVATPSGGAMDSAGGTAVATSTTVLQEASVDEDDLVKSDGVYLYSIAPPASSGALARIQRHVLDPTAADAALGVAESVASPLGADAQLRGLYLDSDHAQLVVLGESGSGAGPVYAQWFSPQSWVGGGTDVAALDTVHGLATRYTLHLGAQLVGSRRVGQRLYLVLRSHAQPTGFDAYWSTTSQSSNQSKLDKLQATDVLPTVSVNGGTPQALLSPDSCLAPAGTDQPSADLITLVGLDLGSAQPSWGARCFSGATEAFYMSAQNVYLATTRMTYTAGNTLNALWYPAAMNTDIHRFALDALAPTYQGSGQVQGHLGFDQNRKSFRLSEHNGLLRVATQQAQTWSPVVGLPVAATNVTTSATSATATATATVNAGASTTDVATPESPVRVTVLRPTSAQALEVLSTLPNARRPDPLGKAGEQLYASRFLGDRGYLVTYRLTDPLYVLDLSDPADPQVSGELSVAGYSDYLFPLSDRYLLGVGKDAQTDGSAGDGRFAWYQGVKVSVIDVSNPAQPQEVAREVIGRRGTDATVLHNHHGIALFNQAQTGVATARARVALPIRLHDSAPAYASGQASDYYSFTRTQLSRLEVDLATGALTRASDLVAADATTDRDIQDDRVVLTANQAHHYRQGAWASWRWD
jgi:hypothetical protein